MGRHAEHVGAAFLIALFVIGMTAAAPAQERVRARIGIQIRSHDRIRWAKLRDRINTRDNLRIYVVPNEDAYLYVVHADQQTARPLLNDKLVKRNEVIVLPSPFNDKFFSFDEPGNQESITIIYSSDRLVDVWDLLKSVAIPRARWRDVEEKLIETGKIVLGSRPDDLVAKKRLVIGGLVRDFPDQANAEGDEVALQITFDRPCRTPLTFRAPNLPPGLRIDAASGLIHGTIMNAAAAASPYAVTVAVEAGDGRPCFSAAFNWTVRDNPAFTKELQALQMSSGKSLLVKRYEFTIKK